jgi:hypothetical protein
MTTPIHLDGADFWLLRHESPDDQPWNFRAKALIVSLAPDTEPSQWGTHLLTEYPPTGPGEATISGTRVWGSGLAQVQERYRDRSIRTPTLLPGDYHPRIWRNGIKWAPQTPRKHQRLPTEATAGRRSGSIAVHRLLDQLAEVIDIVAPHPDNRRAHGPAMRQLLILACTEVEAAWRGVLDANLAPPRRRDRYTSKDYALLADPMRLREYQLLAARYPDEWGVIAPFQTWDVDMATQSLPWYDAYNAAKHNRERDAPLASLEMVMSAVAAAWLLLLAQYGDQSDDVRDVLFHRAGFEIASAPKWSPEELYFPPGGHGFNAKLIFP